MYSFRQRAKMFAEEREKYLDKQTREEILAQYLTDCEAFANDDDSSVDSSINSETLVDVPF